jgi:hypothetical protein
MSDLILHSLIMGCVATAAMDVWAIILKLVFGLGCPLSTNFL